MRPLPSSPQFTPTIVLHKPLHDFRVGVLYAAHIAAEAVLIELFTGIDVPKAAGIGADLVREYDGTVRKAAELQLEIDERDAALEPELFKFLVHLEGVTLDGIDLLLCGEL